MRSWRRRPKVLVSAPVFLRRRGHRELQGEVVDQGANQTAGGHRGTVRTTNYYYYFPASLTIIILFIVICHFLQETWTESNHRDPPQSVRQIQTSAANVRIIKSVDLATYYKSIININNSIFRYKLQSRQVFI